MFQSDAPRTYNISMRGLPSMRSGVTIIWVENLDSPSSWLKNVECTIADITIRVLSCTCLSKCIKYLKRARWYEHVIVVLIANECKDIKAEKSCTIPHLSRLCDYRQTHFVLVVSHILMTYDNDTISTLAKGQNNLTQLLEVFPDCQSMLFRLQQLIDEVHVHEDEPFNQRAQSLRNVREALGGFLWNCSFKS